MYVYLTLLQACPTPMVTVPVCFAQAAFARLNKTHKQNPLWISCYDACGSHQRRSLVSPDRRKLMTPSLREIHTSSHIYFGTVCWWVWAQPMADCYLHSLSDSSQCRCRSPVHSILFIGDVLSCKMSSFTHFTCFQVMWHKHLIWFKSKTRCRQPLKHTWLFPQQRPLPTCFLTGASKTGWSFLMSDKCFKKKVFHIVQLLVICKGTRKVFLLDRLCLVCGMVLVSGNATLSYA